MQQTFTLKTNLFLGFKLFALIFIFAFSYQFSFAQQKAESKQASGSTNNDAGVRFHQINPGVINTSLRSGAICRTVTGDLQAGDLITNTVPIWDGILPAACTNKTTCLGEFVRPGCYYDTINFTNPIASPQCITLTYILNSISGGYVNNVSHDK